MVLAATAMTSLDLDVAEECVQEAYASALVGWQRDGIPRNPAAWLTTVARRKAIDVRRREQKMRPRLPMLIAPAMEGELNEANRLDDVDEDRPIRDERLRLIFMCCHPAISHDAQLALTLRLVCGVSTADIAQILLVSESTMSARLTRAKQKIAVARIPVRVPSEVEMPERLDTVLGVIYLLYTTGHAAPTGLSLHRVDLADEALRLARTIHDLMPGEESVRGLLALCLVIEARRHSRIGPDGRAIRLPDQDRSLWDLNAISEARQLINGNGAAPSRDRYSIQARIALVHAEATIPAVTDWIQIVELYDELLEVWPNPVVRLNRAVALSETRGPRAALEEIAILEDDARMVSYRYLPVVKAHLLTQIGSLREAEEAHARAMDLAENAVEREFLANNLQPRSRI